MGNTSNESFCCPLNKVSLLIQAKARAKEQSISFSEYIINLIENDIKKNEMKIQIPIISNIQQIPEFIPRLFESDKEKREQFKWIGSLNNKELINFTDKLKESRKMVQSVENEKSAQRRAKEARESRAKRDDRIRKWVEENLGKNHIDINIPNEIDDIPIATDDGYAT